MEQAKPTTILVIDDHVVLRAALRMRLKRWNDTFVFYEAESRAQAIELASSHRPHLALVDLTLDDEIDMTLISDLHLSLPAMSILVVSMHDERFYAARALQLGAHGYLMKSDVAQSLIDAVDTVLAGDIWLSESLRKTWSQSPGQGMAERLLMLDPAEREILRLIGEDLGKSEIAIRLGTDEATIGEMREQIKDKLGIASGAELYQFAAQVTKD
jgi:DNA-binding NarL/FixJ family response regulator